MLTVEQHQDEIVGRSEPIQQVFKMIGRVAASDAPVMITGESGSGKELVARAIHNYSARSNKSFLAINCAAIPENLLESELFGHEKGCFTGAHGQRIGRFEQSDKGTLFLDEIGEMPLQVQSKILRVLQEGEFSRVGGNQTIRADVRIVCATNKHLEEEVAQRKFREDLFYRLKVVQYLPPLRSRPEDIRQLAEYFLHKIAHQKHKPQLKLSEEAVRVLEIYPWPGNVRELENTIQRASVLATADVLLPKDIPLGQVSSSSSDGPSHQGNNSAENAIESLFSAASANASIELLLWLEREFTLRAMQKTNNNQFAPRNCLASLAQRYASDSSATASSELQMTSERSSGLDLRGGSLPGRGSPSERPGFPLRDERLRNPRRPSRQNLVLAATLVGP